MRNITKTEQKMLDEILQLFPSVGYYMIYKIGLNGKLINWTWGANFKYVLFYDNAFNTALFENEGGVPEGYQIGKIVIRPAGQNRLHIEVNFIKGKVV